MEKVRELLKNPLYVGIGAGLLGLIVGWFVIGWGIWPVTYYDAAPVNLRSDLQVDYLRMAIDSYAKTGDAVTAKRRYQDLGPDAATYLQEIQNAPGKTFPDDITKFANALAMTAPLPGRHDHTWYGCPESDPVFGLAAHNGRDPGCCGSAAAASCYWSYVSFYWSLAGHWPMSSCCATARVETRWHVCSADPSRPPLRSGNRNTMLRVLKPQLPSL